MILWLRPIPLVALAFALTGCGISDLFKRKPPNKEQFLLQAERPAVEAPPADATTLAVRTFSVAPAFREKGLVYRVSEIEYTSDFYREFFVDPDVMVSEIVGRWIERAGLFTRVIETSTPIEPDYILLGSITSLYGDYRDKRQPKAVLGVRVVIAREEGFDLAPMFQKEYTRALPFAPGAIGVLVVAWNCALQEILTEMEADLRGRPWPPAPAGRDSAIKPPVEEELKEP